MDYLFYFPPFSKINLAKFKVCVTIRIRRRNVYPRSLKETWSVIQGNTKEGRTRHAYLTQEEIKNWELYEVKMKELSVRADITKAKEKNEREKEKEA